MRAPLSWLQSLTPLDVSPTDAAAVGDLGAELDALGLVVEGVERVGEGLDDVILAQVLDISAIEGADRIRKIVVDVGSGPPVDVVCGAWNFEAGDVVAFAPVGSELPGGFRIEARKMKGVASNGMICSTRELAIGDDHDGIMVLARPGGGAAAPAGVTLGATLGSYLGFAADVVFDLAVEPNRPDCLCMLGVARDLAAKFGLGLSIPTPLLVESGPAASSMASVAVADEELCFRLTGRVMTNVTLVPSPLLVQRRLTLAGMRPIDCLVDASNYVMLELGQPTHPYDLDRLGGSGLSARAATVGEQLVTLDGTSRTLGTRAPRAGDPVSGRDCVICDANDVPVGVGGIMGGQSSEIDSSTTRVLLEAALFLPVGVGRTARYLGLRSEASVRFERGVDPGGVERATARVFELVLQAAVTAGVPAPVVAPGLLDTAASRPAAAPVRVTARVERVNSLLGTDLSSDAIVALLEPIGYSVHNAAAESAVLGRLELSVPSFRPDVRREVDVIEDVARTFGYRNIVRTERRSPYVGSLSAVQHLRRRLRRLLVGLGAHEAWTTSLIDPADHLRAGIARPLVTLANPMVAEESALRSSLLPGLLTVVRHNSGHRNQWLRLFEIGDVFSPSATEAGLPVEPERVAVIFAREGDSVASAMDAWRRVADALRIVGAEVDQSARPADEALAGLHSARSGYLVAGDGLVLGVVGEVDPEVVAAFGLAHDRIGWLDLDMAAVASAPRRSLTAAPVSKYPSSDVDLAFVLSDDVAAWRVEAGLRSASEIVESVVLFDVYRGAGVDAGARSLAYRVRFRALDRTLSDVEVAGLRQVCIDAVCATVPAVLRG